MRNRHTTKLFPKKSNETTKIMSNNTEKPRIQQKNERCDFDHNALIYSCNNCYQFKYLLWKLKVALVFFRSLKNNPFKRIPHILGDQSLSLIDFNLTR